MGGFLLKKYFIRGGSDTIQLETLKLLRRMLGKIFQ